MSPVRIFPGSPDFINVALNTVAQALPDKQGTKVTIKNQSAVNLIVSHASGAIFTLLPATSYTFTVAKSAKELSVATANGNYALEAEVWG